MLDSLALARVPLVFSTLVTLLMFLVGGGLGRRLLLWLRVSLPDPLERGVFAVGLGMGALTFLPFLLFALGIGRPAVVAGSLLLLALVLLPDEIRCARGAWRGVGAGMRAWRQSHPAWTWLLAGLFALLLMETFVLALCPPTDADGLHYHLTGPRRYLATGGFHYLPTYLHLNWPLAVEMLFALGLAFSNFYTPGLVQFGLGIALLLGTYALGRRIASPAVGWLAVALVLPYIRPEMAWAYIDVGLALFTLLAIYAFFIGWQGLHNADEANAAAPAPGEAGRWWILSALFAGLAAATKLNGILWVGALAAMAFAAYWARPQAAAGASSVHRFRATLRPALLILALGILVALPWYARCWMQTGSPMYPYFWSLLGAKDWSAEAHRRMNAYFQMFNTLRSLNPTPQQVVLSRAILSLLLIGAGLFLGTRRGAKPVLPLLAFCCIGLFLQVATSGIYTRFFLPLLPLLAVLIAWALRTRLERPAFGWGAALIAALLLVGPKPHRTLPGIASTLKERLPVATGGVSRDAFLAEKIWVYPMMRWMNANLPPNAVPTLAVWDSFGSLSDHATLTTHAWTQNALRYDRYENLLHDLKRLGATHLLLKQEPPLTERQKADLNREDRLRHETEFALLRRVGAEYGALLHTEGDYRLYTLHLP